MRQAIVCACLLFVLGVLAGCEKADFGKDKPEEKPEPPVEVPTDTLGVLQTLHLAEKGTDDELAAINAVGIRGYIVGAIPGLMLSYAVFSAPYNTNSNILIADDKNETNPERCMPVRLVKGTAFREELNLQDNPGNKGRLILVAGEIKTYFKTYGVYALQGYEWLSEAGADGTPDDSHGGNPYISSDTELIEGGR